jgi:hypothetical protein
LDKYFRIKTRETLWQLWQASGDIPPKHGPVHPKILRYMSCIKKSCSRHIIGVDHMIEKLQSSPFSWYVTLMNAVLNGEPDSTKAL